MSDQSSQTSRVPAAPGTSPEVRIEVRHGGSATTYPVGAAGFLVGSVPGCDLRVPGKDLPALLCLIAPVAAGGVHFRKLAPTQAILRNGKSASTGSLDP